MRATLPHIVFVLNGNYPLGLNRSESSRQPSICDEVTGGEPTWLARYRYGTNTTTV